MRSQTMLKTIFGTLLATGVTALALGSGIGTAQARSSVWDGVYTDAQAEHGHTLYTQSCARCHGVDLSGTFEIPPLVGRFMPYWSGSTLDALFDYVSTAMPLDHPGALGPSANADIVLDKREDVLAINEGNLIIEAKQTFVEVETAPQQFEKREIQAGLSDGINIEVVSGLKPEDKIKHR